MASGHVNRANRPNTWLLRPMLRVKILLANPEPSTHGPKRRSENVCSCAAFGVKRTSRDPVQIDAIDLMRKSCHGAKPGICLRSSLIVTHLGGRKMQRRGGGERPVKNRRVNKPKARRVSISAQSITDLQKQV